MSASDTPEGPTAKRGRVLSIALWLLQVLLAVYFLALAAVPKLLGSDSSVEMFEHIGFGQWLRYLTGLCELAGAIGLLVPRLSGLAALGLMGVMVGATLANLFRIPDALPFAAWTALLGVVFALVAWGRWSDTRKLFSMLRR